MALQSNLNKKTPIGNQSVANGFKIKLFVNYHKNGIQF
jgi:hypothetical protein